MEWVKDSLGLQSPLSPAPGNSRKQSRIQADPVFGPYTRGMGVRAICVAFAISFFDPPLASARRTSVRDATKCDNPSRDAKNVYCRFRRYGSDRLLRSPSRRPLRLWIPEYLSSSPGNLPALRPLLMESVLCRRRSHYSASLKHHDAFVNLGASRVQPIAIDPIGWKKFQRRLLRRME
jgi:hypothetical protein